MRTAGRASEVKEKRKKRAKQTGWAKFRINPELKTQLEKHCVERELDFSEWARDTLQNQMIAERDELKTVSSMETRLEHLERLVSRLADQKDDAGK